MGNDGPGIVVGLPSPQTVKVHIIMCSELLKHGRQSFKNYSRNRSSLPVSGMKSLCLLNNGIAETSSLLQHCSESSTLYLALNGDAILSRCTNQGTYWSIASAKFRISFQ